MVREVRPRPRRFVRARFLVLFVFVVVISPAIYSYTTTMMKPSSLPLWPRSVEWLRAHHGNWLVDEVEHYYYSWKAPKKGGPQLAALPSLGVRAPRAEKTHRIHHGRHQAVWPPAIGPVFPHPLPGEGVWNWMGAFVQGKPPVLVTTFRTEVDYPRIVAYVAWFDHRRTSVAYYPGRYEPPSAPDARADGGALRPAVASARDVQQRVHLPRRRQRLVDRRPRVRAAEARAGDVDRLPRRTRRHPDVERRAVAGPRIAFARQSLPLIVDHGQLSPALNDSTQWGYTLGNAVRVWRTGAGIDRHGNLIYAAADYQTVTTLARILQRAGAVRAMQLDINPEWPTLITYTHHGGLDTTKIVPNYQQPATRYLVPDDRDFFAVYRRVPGPVTVPFR